MEKYQQNFVQIKSNKPHIFLGDICGPTLYHIISWVDKT